MLPIRSTTTHAPPRGISQARSSLLAAARIASMAPYTPAARSGGIANRMLAVPTIYTAAIIGAASASARGMVRRGSRISASIKEAASGPVKAKANAVQKMTSARRNDGTIVCRLMAVAEPKRHHVTSASTISSTIPSQRATAPAPFNHFALASPRTLRMVAPRITAIEKQTKYTGEAFPELPGMESRALPAEKYKTLGKKASVPLQYVHPVINPANGPKARWVQEHRPPSSG